jgi:hypothetical protein
MCITAIENLIVIGFSDGSGRIFSSDDREIKVFSDKSIKNNAATCVDV